VAVEWIAVGELTLELERPDDPESLIDETAFADDEFLPYWAELWPSGIALAHQVAALPLEGARVLELGCGLGLPSLVAAAHGANVVATDWAQAAISLLGRNAERNSLELTALVADWREGAALPAGRFDLILAADVLYEARNAAPLLAALGDRLAPGGSALVADPGRRHAATFAEAARAAFTVEERDGDWASAARLYVVR
jgi:predicted nicotinamide N-methyase